MTEEEYFRKNYLDSCYGDRPLSPYWDFFQDGVEFGERHSEKKMEELEKENKDLRDNYDQFKAIAEPEIERLKKENAELKEHIKADCIDCADYIKNQKLKKENADLKTDKQYWEQKANRLITEWRETLDKLTKAKEIIKQFLNDYPVITKELLDKLEKFLKDKSQSEWVNPATTTNDPFVR